MVFFIISGVWIALISDKYGKLTVGTAGDYNHEFVGPQSSGHFVYYHGLIKPPNEFAVSAWEDPSYFKMKSWSALESWNNFKYQIMLILNNTLKIINIFEVVSLFSIIIIIAAIILIFKLSPNDTSKNKLIYLIITILIYAGGYSLIWVDSRYIWVTNILLLIMGAYLLNILFKQEFINKTSKNILLILLIFSFVINPVNSLATNPNIGIEIYNLSETLKSNYGVHGNLASNSKWEISDYIAYYMGSKYYGKTKENESYEDLKNELKHNNIDYYFVWDNSKENNYLSHDFKEVTHGTIKSLRVYSMKS